MITFVLIQNLSLVFALKKGHKVLELGNFCKYLPMYQKALVIILLFINLFLRIFSRGRNAVDEKPAVIHLVGTYY